MSKKEKIFPINTVGGRIQHLRLKRGITRSQLYDYLRPDDPVATEESKNKTVYNWESGNTELDYWRINAVCSLFDCSADYLILGKDECTNKDIQFIHDKTGLSEASINILVAKKEEYDTNMSNIGNSLDNSMGILKRKYPYWVIEKRLKEVADYLYNDGKQPDIFTSDKESYRHFAIVCSMNKYLKEDSFFSLADTLIKDGFEKEIDLALTDYAYNYYKDINKDLGDNESVATYVFDKNAIRILNTLRENRTVSERYYKEYETERQKRIEENERLKLIAKREIEENANKEVLEIEDEDFC